MLEASGRHELHADADAEERLSPLAHRLMKGVHHARHRVEAAAAIGEGADARQHDAVGAGDAVRIGRDLDRDPEASLARRALKSLGGRMEVARTVIDEGDAHRGRSASGNRPITGSGARRAIGAAKGRGASERPASQRRNVLSSASSAESASTTSTAGRPCLAKVQRLRLDASRPIRSASRSSARKTAPGLTRRRSGAARQADEGGEHAEAREPEAVRGAPQEGEQEGAREKPSRTSSASLERAGLAGDRAFRRREAV